ncbi:MAG: carbamoyltransferase HypF [Dactylosporangium sp.]|nr:carbamoyltransferase HypF [Dactylosporangium sp.]
MDRVDRAAAGGRDGVSPRPDACRIEVRGTVQGVGFRPFVWRLATELGLDGTVRNVDGRVEIEAHGPAQALESLVARLRTEPPTLAGVESVIVRPLRASLRTPPAPGFSVVASHHASGQDRRFPPDIATCDACTRELLEPADRRYRYPFINCTDCGPRATIIDALPYDRARTTMADFPLCPACAAEYADPADRRFHAEPVACPACGPVLAWHPADPAGPGPGGTPGPAVTGDPALGAAIAALARGAVVAVKGLGGYHLACDATNEEAVARLRARKHRWAKPLAVMVADLPQARKLANLTPAAEALLLSPARPIVLATAVADATAHPPLAASVRAGIRTIGLFLPYTGLHHLLLADFGRPLVLTSGNRCDEPIAVDNDEAVTRLAGIADGFLSHNRRIRSRYEDSVVAASGGPAVLLRRGRGYAPTPLGLPVGTPEPVLAVGAQLKHTFAIAKLERAHLAGHLGDLEDLATMRAFERNLDHLRGLLEVDPTWVAHDLHPGYLSTQYAVAAYPADRRIAVQHHHAHTAACLAEHGLTGPVVGVALDGLGLGDDGTFWGGEVLIADLVSYRRVGRFGRAPMPGGAAAVREPWRMVLGYLFGAEAVAESGTGGPGEAGAAPGEPDWCDASAWLARLDPTVLTVIRRQLARGINAPLASSAGRLFDAASAILGLCAASAYEGQAAILLEQAADPAEPGALPHRIAVVDGVAVYDPRPTLAALLAATASGTPTPRLAARFQRAVAAAVADLAVRAAEDAGLDTVCLSGGVFCNAWLLAEVPRRLEAAGLTAVHHDRVPPGDGGISFGQAVVAAARLAAGIPSGQGDGTPCV